MYADFDYDVLFDFDFEFEFDFDFDSVFTKENYLCSGSTPEATAESNSIVFSTKLHMLSDSD